MKRVAACVLLVFCYFFANLCCSLFNYLSTYGMILNSISLILTILLSIGIAFLSFILSQKISYSSKGLRYKILSIFTMIIGIITAIGTLTTVNENAKMFDLITNPKMLLMFLMLLLNPTFIFGVVLFILYKNKY